MKKLIGALLFLTLIAVFIAGCSDTNNATGPNPVHMDETSFLKQSITIKKGEVVTLINDVGAVHVIANGTWDNGVQRPKVEPGAPKIDNVMVSGNGSEAVGPFNTAGTFKIYCTVHTDMAMTIIVK